MNAPALPSADRWQQWGVDPSWSRSLDVASHDGGSHRWHVLERRPADLAASLGTVVCVHGNPTWSYLWHRVIDRLGDRYHVVAVDQLGMGFSDRPVTRSYAQRVLDLQDVIDALELEGPLVMVGQDWGGAIVQGWSVAHQDRLAGLVLCNTGIAVPSGRHAPALIRLAAAGPITDLACRRTRVFVDGTMWLSWKRIPRAMREAFRAPYRRAADRTAIRDFVAEWETGHEIAVGVKEESHEKGPTLFVRRMFYRLIDRLSEVPLVRNFTGFGLYDRVVIDTLREIDDPYPYFRGLICDLGYARAEVPYRQAARRRGITKNNFYTLYDLAMLGITNHSKVPLRLATMAGFALSLVGVLVAVAYLIMKLAFWSTFSLGLAPLVIGVYFLASVQLFFIGIVGEYIGSIHTQVYHRPLVIEKERINFD